MLPVSTRPRVSAEDTHARVERRLRRYAAPVQAAVRATADIHPRVADLALSFPVLLFALAVPRRGVDVAHAIEAVIAGRSLSEVARLTGTPLWLRRMPVDALVKPLPVLPDGDIFRRRIANHIPRSPKLVPLWLDTVAFAAQWAHEPFAIWIARELIHGAKDVKLKQIRLMCVWAFFSQAPGTIGHRLVETPWRPAMRFKTALGAAWAWHTRAGLHVNIGEAPLADMWLKPGCVYNYEFVPLRSAEEIVEEANAMDNCLKTYGYNLAHNRSRLWSVRKDGRRVATLRLAYIFADPLIGIRELSGERNSKVSVEVWWAARQWLHQQDLPAINTQWRHWDKAPLDAQIWRALWRPYWLAKRRIPAWLTLAPSRDALETV